MHIKFKYYSLLLILSSTLMSCDFQNSTKICNQTNDPLNVIIEFDTSSFPWTPKGNSNFFENFHDGNMGLKIMKYDFSSYIGHYTIAPDTCGEIEGGPNRWPSFSYFNKITIISTNDTIILDSKDKMKDQFHVNDEDQHYDFDLIIK